MALLRTFFYLVVLSLSVLMFLGLISNVTRKQDDYIDTSLNKLKALIADMIDELIPIDIHELKILSWLKVAEKTKKGVTSGYLTTIFQEKVFAYSYENFGDETLLHATTDKTAYTFHKQDRKTKVSHQEQEIGDLISYNGFYELETEEGTVYKAINAGTNSYSIRKNDTELAIVYLGDPDDLSNDRLFKMIDNSSTLASPEFISVFLYLLLLRE